MAALGAPPGADAGEEAGDDGEEAGSGEPGPGKARDPRATLRPKDLLELAHCCHNKLKRAEQREVDAVISRLASQAEVQRDESPSASAGARAKRTADLSRQVLAQARDVAASAREAPPKLASEPPQPVGAVRECIEREAARWWSSTIKEVVSRASDGKDGKAFAERLSERLLAALPAIAREPEVTGALAEQLRPAQRQLERCIQEELKAQSRTAGAEELRAALREGEVLLEAAVDDAMRSALVAMTDEKIRRAAQHLRSATSADVLFRAAETEATAVVRGAIAAIQTAPVAGGSRVHSGAAAASPAGPAAALVARLRADVRPLEASLSRLTADVGSLWGELARLERRGEPEDPEGARGEVRRLLASGRCEEAFVRALKYDASSVPFTVAASGSPAPWSMAEWCCDEALKECCVASAEEFLAQEPSLLSAAQRLPLMAALTRRAVERGAPAERVEANLDWVLCLAETLELPALGPGGDAAFLAEAAGMAEALDSVLHGTAPLCISEARPDLRQRITRSARMAAKQLELLRRSASSG